MNPLWLALYLPQLPLECATGTAVDHSAAQLVYQTSASKQTVYRLNDKAASAGIEPGMPLSAARSLCADLVAIERDTRREKNALYNLALWALQFTSKVSLEPPDGLVLEIGASLSLFGGLPPLQQSILGELDAIGYSAFFAIAPIAGAAWLLALNRTPKVISDTQQLTRELLQLPLSLLAVPLEKKTALYRLGLRSIGDCQRLPRAGLAQRLGPELLNSIDRALGRRPEVREFIDPPDHFDAQILLTQPVEQIQPLLFILQRLLRQLCGYLRARDAATQGIRLGLIRPLLPVEWLQLTLLQPSRDPEHLFKLWQEKLERHRLQSPVEGLELQVRQLLPLRAQTDDLLALRQKSSLSFVQMLERLKSRLGENLIQQPFCTADHRPERSGRLDLFPTPSPAIDKRKPARPLWLLPQPQPLQQTRDGGPLLQGALTLVSGPERIESGWWDGRGQRRDYYIAHNPQQQRLWIYRTLKQPQRWFLHGYFS